jgi:hypothetical protein
VNKREGEKLEEINLKEEKERERHIITRLD